MQWLSCSTSATREKSSQNQVPLLGQRLSWWYSKLYLNTSFRDYPLVIKIGIGKSPITDDFPMEKPTKAGASIAMFDYQRVQYQLEIIIPEMDN